jgi:hypothetical protein
MILKSSDTPNQLKQWLIKNLSESNRIKACGSSVEKVPSVKGIYFWFIKEDGLSKLNKIEFPSNLTFVNTRKINGSKYHLVYIGTAGARNNSSGSNTGNLRERLNWHLSDNKSISALYHGTMSTYRRTIGSLLMDDLIANGAQRIIDDFLCKYFMIYYIEYPGNFSEVQNEINNDESILIKSFKPIFNIAKNPNVRISGNICHSIKLRRQKIEKKSKDWCFKQTKKASAIEKKVQPKSKNQIKVLDNCIEFCVNKNQNIIEVLASIKNVPSGPCSIELFSESHLPIKTYINGKVRKITTSKRTVISYFNSPDTKLGNLSRWKIIRDEMNDLKKPIEKITVRVCSTNILQATSGEKALKAIKSNSMISEKNVPIKVSKNYKVVMICASNKRNSFFSQYPTLTFVAAPLAQNQRFPNGQGPKKGKTWRDYLIANQNDKSLLPAYRLYTRHIYQDLRNNLKDSFYILSAGWGLVRSDFKLPNYDITFSANPGDQNYRNKKLNVPPIHNDFQQLELGNMEDIIFIGSPDYLNLFFQLTQHLPNRKIIFYKKANTPIVYQIPNNTFVYRYYNTNRSTGWYYKLAENICNGIIP